MEYKLSEEYSEDVKKIQSRLMYYNFLETSDIDGYFGINTQNAVKKFQINHGLNVDGIIGAGTYNLLFSDKSKKDIDEDLYKPNDEKEEIASIKNEGSFFKETSEEPLRKDNGDIEIRFSQNENKNKVLKNVYYRSVGFSIDPRTGEAIGEMYEFVAKDMKSLEN